MMSGILYPRGFLLTSSASVAEGAEALLPEWQSKAVADGWWLLANPEPPPARPGKPTSKPTDLPSGVLSAGLDRGSAVLLMGHAVDPWNGRNGPDILQALRRSLPPGRLPQVRDRSVWEILDALSGRFVLAVLDRDLPWIVQDAVGLHPLFYSSGTDAFAASSHAQLLAEVMGLERDPMVDELVTSRFYQKGLQHLPGLRTPFLGMKMLTPNTFLDVKGDRVVRFFPREPHGPVEDWSALVEESAGVLTRSVQALAREPEVAVPLSPDPDSDALLKCNGAGIGRAFYCKAMGVPELPATLTPRHMSNLYKRNLFNRRLLRWTDDCFREFRAGTGFGQEFFDYEEGDLFYWEHRMPQWAALAIQDPDMVHDTLSIFNNRRLLANLLKPARPDRISDRLHRDVILALRPEVLQLPLPEKTGLKARIRQLLERWWFRLNA
jgi:hypothetical protein